MKLKEWFKVSDADTVKIGVEEGSSFMYCGKVVSPSRIIDRMFFNIIDLINEYQKHTSECEPDEVWEQKKIAEVRREINSRVLELARFHDVLNREVIEEYPSTAVKNQAIIEVESKCSWNLPYWDIEEFDKRWKYGYTQVTESEEVEDNGTETEV